MVYRIYKITSILLSICILIFNTILSMIFKQVSLSDCLSEHVINNLRAMMRSFLQRHPLGRLFGRQALRRLGAGCHGSGGTACHGGMEGRGLACLGCLYENGK